MIAKLKQMWAKAAESPADDRQHSVSLAVAALMVEIMRMDGKLEQAERNEIIQRLQQRFDLSPSDIDALIEQASEKVEQALDMHQFTSVVVKGFSTAERIDILAELWAVALADGHVDAYEEQLIRRMADLMGLHHSQFIQAKITAGVG
ncbi:MAG: TerB family tellurite resistance protein [Mariprofundus sp.]|nr:TerB family tellurite resistance protein [Mariprofundus sp.]